MLENGDITVTGIELDTFKCALNLVKRSFKDLSKAAGAVQQRPGMPRLALLFRAMVKICSISTCSADKF